MKGLKNILKFYLPPSEFTAALIEFSQFKQCVDSALFPSDHNLQLRSPKLW